MSKIKQLKDVSRRTTNIVKRGKQLDEQFTKRKRK